MTSWHALVQGHRLANSCIWAYTIRRSCMHAHCMLLARQVARLCSVILLCNRARQQSGRSCSRIWCPAPREESLGTLNMPNGYGPRYWQPQRLMQGALPHPSSSVKRPCTHIPLAGARACYEPTSRVCCAKAHMDMERKRCPLFRCCAGSRCISLGSLGWKRMS